jgi:threonine aldolase
VIEEARAHRHRMGGSMRQSGIIAAAGIVALETMVERLADDHARARKLAEAIAQRWPGALDPELVRTNIVCAPLEVFPSDLLAQLQRERVLAGLLDARTVRFVTHKDVDDHDLTRVIKVLDALAV